MSPKPPTPKQRKGGVSVIKTTVHLPEDLWREAKVRALDERKDLRTLIIEGLRLVLARKKGGR